MKWSEIFLEEVYGGRNIMRHTLFCFQELNAVYNLKQEQEIQSQQSHLLHNLQNTISGAADNNFETVQAGDTSALHQTYFEVKLI